MQFIVDFFVGILVVYLAITNNLANYIEQFLVPTPNNVEVADINTTLQRLPSHSTGIPSILIDNAAYQGATLIGSEELWRSTADETTDAIVNILCTFTTDTYIRTTTGTGFIIHPDGVILTNAHVAQFLLLEATNNAGEAQCVARMGNPAVPVYELSLLYIPPAWIQEHANLIDTKEPSGTGERDYALLYASSGLNNQPMPRVFPSLSPDLNPLTINNRNDAVMVAGYPAKDFQTLGPNVALMPVLAGTSISELYTFSTEKADVIAVRGSTIGEHGSSGGPILNNEGLVIGMISTQGNDVVDGVGSLRGISIEYIARTIEEETGFSLFRNVTGNLPYRAQIFNDTLAPFLTTLLAREFNN